MSSKFLIILFVFSLVALAFDTDDCYGQRMRGGRSGNRSGNRSFNRGNTNPGNTEVQTKVTGIRTLIKETAIYQEIKIQKGMIKILKGMIKILKGMIEILEGMTMTGETGILIMTGILMLTIIMFITDIITADTIHTTIMDIRLITGAGTGTLRVFSLPPCLLLRF